MKTGNRPTILLVTEDGFDPVFSSANLVLSQDYSDAVSAAGGVPVTAMDIRTCPEYTKLADALLLTGGGIIHPARYNGLLKDFSELQGFSNTRDDMDFTLADLFIKAGKPVLGIGRGAMVLNALLGGKIEKHLPALPEKSTDTLSGGLEKLLGKEVTFQRVYSWGIESLAENLHEEAVSPEGIIDGFSHETLPVKGVVWHPERAFDEENKDLKLFEWLVSAAAGKNGEEEKA